MDIRLLVRGDGRLPGVELPYLGDLRGDLFGRQVSPHAGFGGLADFYFHGICPANRFFISGVKRCAYLVNIIFRMLPVEAENPDSR